MPSFARASFEDSFGVRAGAMDDYPPQYTKRHLRGRSIKSSSSLFSKAHGRHGVKESWISQQQQQFQQFQQLQQLQHWQEPDYLERKSTSSSLVSSISNGRASDAPPTTDTSKQRDLESGLPPPLTREEFEALPLAIQRKYFSTLERLRFAQSSSGVDGIFKHYCETSKRSSPRPDKGVVEPSTGRRRRLSLRTTTNDTIDTDVFTLTDTLPGRSRRHLTREEQVALARNLRASVLLDAADEAVGRARRRASTTFTSDYGTSICSPDRLSMESMRCELPDVAMNQSDAPSTRPESLCDSFRWLDDDEDLDLRLFLSDYHANLRDTLPQPAKDHQHQHPSFRRHMSISKIPFGRSSASWSRPGTKDASTPTSPLQNPTSAPTSTSQHARRRSRTLSLITSRHAASESRETLPPIDPAAAHYQDPEARLKLRVFLASPQKFDEAIAFGFPSTDPRAPPSVPVKDIVVPPSSGHSRQQSSRAAAPGKLETFLADFDEDDNESDDKLSYSDQISAADPESPRTPHSTTDKSMIRPMRLPSVPSPDEYGQAQGSSREMTLKMTLTRPDLRATEDQIYGWKQHGAYSVRKSPSAGGRDDMFPPALPGGRDSMDRNPGGLDHWGPSQDHNVMKRIWNRVRRS